MNRRRRLRLAGLVLLGVAVFFSPSSGWSATAGESHGADLFNHPRDKTRIKRRWGIEIVSMRRTAAGYMLDFRYRVLDAEKAKPVFERRYKPVLIHELTGARFAVPAPGKVGPLRNSNFPQQGRIYWMAFANPGKFIEPGDRVTVVIGDFRAEHLVVQ
jgi:hypothetical protein